MLNIREPVLAWDFDKAVMKRLLLWDNERTAAMWGGEVETPDNEEAAMAAIPVISGGVKRMEVAQQ